MLPLTHRNLRLPTLHPALEPHREQLEALAKPAWLLNAHPVSEIPRTETQFNSPTPFVPASEGWPPCKHCGDPLYLVWQINFGEFSASGMFADHGLFQFFYCWTCFPPYNKEISPNIFEPEYPGYIPMVLFEKQLSIAFRWYPEFDEAAAESIPQATHPPVDLMEKAQGISPVPYLSVPDYLDDINPILSTGLGLENEWPIDDYASYRTASPTKDFMSQLGGHPVWVQNDEAPSCPVCGTRAELVGAVGSDDTGLIWGDSGYWYIFACKATDRCLGLRQPLMLSQST